MMKQLRYFYLKMFIIIFILSLKTFKGFYFDFYSFLFYFIFQAVIEDFKNLQPSLSNPLSRPILQNLLTVPTPRTFSNLREPLFARFSWPRTANPSSRASSRPNSEAPRASGPSVSSTRFSVDQLLNPADSFHSKASASSEQPPRVTVSLPEDTTLSLVVEPPVSSSSVVQLEPRSRELQISRVDNPGSSPATDLVTLSPQHLSTIDVLPLETADVSLSSSSSSPADEIFL